MKKSKKILSVLLTLALVFSTMIGTSAVTYADEASESTATIILYTSNIRGDIDAIAKVAAIKSACEAEGNEVILADTGNFLQGSIYASADRGNTVFELMEKAGYDVVALGKYDFAFGDGAMGAKPHGTLVQYLTLSDLLNGKEDVKDASSIVAVSTNASGSNANFTFTGNMTSKTVITTKSGKKIGFVGVTDSSATDELLETSMTGITFDEPKEKIDAAIAEMADVDAVVCLSNAGAIETNAILLTAEEATLSAISIGADGTVNNLGPIGLDDQTATEEMAALVSSIKEKTGTSFPNVATSSVTLNGSQTAVRSQETNLGDFWTDALRWFALEGGMENYFSEEYVENGHTGLEVEANKVVAIWNGGNLRNYMYAGDIIAQDVHAVLPYPNTVAVAYVTGEQLLEALEATLQYDAAFASVSGIEYNIDKTVELDLGDVYEGAKYQKPNSIKQVTINSINGEAFDPAETYAVITSNMIFNGGDTYCVFKGKAGNSTNTTKKVVDAVWAYVESLGGVIGSEYAQPQGRITMTHVHKAVVDNAVEPTCKEEGKTEGTHCGICGEIIVAQEKVDKLAHDYETKTTKATTSVDGKIVEKCKVCGDSKTTTIKKIASTSLSKSTYVYDGKAKKPAVTVKDSAGKSIAKSNYTVSYKNNTKVGKATVTVTFKGNYKGTVSKSFKINPKATSITSLTKGTKSFTVKWAKKTTETTGYQVRYATKSSMSGAVKVTISKNTTTSKTVKSLKAKKKYYVQVRAYKTIGSTKYYSAWSDKKTVTTK